MKYRIKDYPELREKVRNMPVRDLLNAIICPDLLYGKHEMVRNTPAALLHAVPAETAKLCSSMINDGREEPALIVADLEAGAGDAIVGAVRFPSMRGAAESKDENLVYEMGAIAAKEARLAGYHWSFGPCVDILGNTENPIVNIRTSGEDPDTVIRYGGAYLRGLQENGLIATLKHFPGDGYCLSDQHITTTENPLSREEWDKTYGRVYQTLIDEGAMSIMPGHISLPAYDEIDPDTGLYPPATMSKNLMTGLLREKLGFEGIIVSDAMNMNGFCGYRNLYDGICRFLEGGGDCLLFVHSSEEYLSEMEKRINGGKLSLETLRDRVYRMKCFAKEYFEKAAALPPVEFDRAAAEKTAKEIVDKSVRVVRDRVGLLPKKIDSSTRIAHFVLSTPGTTDGTFDAVTDLTAKLSAIAGKVDEIRDPGPGNALRAVKSGNYDLVVCSVLNKVAWGLNLIKLSGPMARNMMNGWMRYGVPTVFVSYYDPYFGDVFKACADTVINAYGYTPYTNDAIMRLLTEEN